MKDQNEAPTRALRDPGPSQEPSPDPSSGRGDGRAAVTAFLGDLAGRGFGGRARPGRAARVVSATDNSIYYREPACVVEPASAGDVQAAVAGVEAEGLAVAPRGGGTGTNGQSLTAGVVIDGSRFMNRILGITEDPDGGTATVRVEPGVVLDQLNAWLAPRGYFFPPAVSTGSRATLGGMVATDASGKGSRRYGRTSDYLVSADLVMADGSLARVADLPAGAPLPPGPLGAAAALLRAELPGLDAEIARVFPVMNRGLTGYNLDELRGPGGLLRLPKLIAGSEGTLAVTVALELRVVKRPARTGIAIIGYADSLVALGAVGDLLPADPDAIEFLDDRTVQLGRTTPAWPVLEPVLGAGLAACGGYLFAEVSGATPDEVAARLAAVEAALAAGATPAAGIVATADPEVMAALNGLRRDAVGLMGKGNGPFKGMAFVEDAAVPPGNLVSFVAGFRDILDAHGLDYGMYGHADVGCVHVRPLMDMRLPEHRALIRPISDAVAELAHAEGGLIWGEHGKGVRGEYVEYYFGPRLFGFLRRIKAAFDPGNLLNPGKLVTAEGSALAVERIDEIAFRGARDARIAGHEAYGKASECNGNGACFHWDVANEMCPSYKATRDRVQSPKGRAALVRDWLHARETGGPVAEAEAALADTLATCLSCKACSSQCPVQVDIPTMKARFLADTVRSRTPRDRLLRHMERLTLAGARLPGLANLALGLGRGVLERRFGLVDLPRFAPRGLEARMRAAGSTRLAGGALPAGTDPDRAAILLCDSFLGVFEPGVLESAARVLAGMGIRVFHTPVQRNGKAAQVRGYLGDFEATRDAALARIGALGALGLPILTVEPAVTMLYRQDYGAAPGLERLVSIDRFLAARRALLPRAAAGGAFRLIGHCTETSADPGNLSRWAQVFAAAGLGLESRRAGCCGMAGLFGHEAEHRDLSRQIFDLGWAGHVAEEGAGAGELLATGFSCRGQAERFAGAALRHPVEALAEALAPAGGRASG